MEANTNLGSNSKSTIEDEESSLLERLIALKKQLEADEEPKFLCTKTIHGTKKNVSTNEYVVSSNFKYCKVNNQLETYNKPKLLSTKENVSTNEYVISSKSKYSKVNNHNVNKFHSRKIDNRNLIKNQNKIKQTNLFIKSNWSSSKISATTNSSNLLPLKSETIVSKTNPEIVKNSQSIEKYNLEANEIVKNSIVCNVDSLLNTSASDCKSFLATVDSYMMNVQNYLTSSIYVVDKVDTNILSNNQTNKPAKNVHVNRKFKDQLMSNSLLDSNSRTSNALIANKKIITKKKPIKGLSEKCVESPHLVKISNTKLIRQSMIRNKSKFNNTSNCISNNINYRKPLSTLQCPTSSLLITSCNNSKWTKATNQTPALSPKLLKSSNTSMLKWTKPNLLMINNMNNNRSQHNIVQQTDKLILFGQNKIIRQSLISSIQSKKLNYFRKHFTHRIALLRKLQGKMLIKAKHGTITNDLVRNTSLLKKTSSKPDEIKKNRNRLHSTYSYINPISRLNTNNSCSLKKTESFNLKTPCSYNKSLNLKVVNNDTNKHLNLNLANNNASDRIKSKKTFTKQLCLVFNRFGICSKLDQGICDKRHYKKYITLCIKFLTGECFTENCKLSHVITEEKIPFCKHYLNNICVQLNCPYLHEYRDSKTPICKNFLHGYCTLGRRCPKKHLNLCPIFESKNKCPHGQNCLYPHYKSEEKKAVDDEIYEPRYFERPMPSNEESKENKSYHIVPKRHAPLNDLPSYIPL